MNGGDIAIATDGSDDVVRRIFHAYAETDSSLWDIAHELNTEGIPSPSNRKWNSSGVGCILRREPEYTVTKVTANDPNAGPRGTDSAEIPNAPNAPPIKTPIPPIPPITAQLFLTLRNQIR